LHRRRRAYNWQGRARHSNPLPAFFGTAQKYGGDAMGSVMQLVLLLIVMAGFGLLEATSKRALRYQVTPDDTKLELAMFVSLIAITQPLIILVTNALCQAFMPASHDALLHLPLLAMVALLLIGDDLTQYLWHRASHTPLLWPLHRAHHTAHYMSLRVTYRNNFFYYAMMPGIWIAALLVYLGLGKVYAVYVLVKLAVIVGAHSAWRWDEPLYRVRGLSPVMWVVERTISTPATHWAHHALTNADGVGHYKGNFGNLLFFWDVLFGTAKITRQYPPAVGLQDDNLYGKERWFTEMFYPLVQSRREHSALRFGARAYAESETASDAKGAAPALAE
jgi:sterol desaturase/sphingolipid hydroxylase (fatty acid hydroxylase superfamily)